MKHALARWKAFLSIALAVMVVAGFSQGFRGTAVAQDDPEPQGLVRFVHAYSGGGPVDLYVDDALLVEGIAFGTASKFALLPEGDREIAIVTAGEPLQNALATNEISVDANKAYNVVVGGQEDELEARRFEVNQDDLDADQARLRFIQGEPGAGPVNIELTTPTDEPQPNADDDFEFPSFSDVGLEDGNDYQTVSAGSYGMDAVSVDNDNLRFTLPSIDLTAGNVYDIVVLGQLETENLTFLPLITTVDANCGDLLGVGEEGDACVRIVHTSADAGSVDIYIDDAMVASDVSYGLVTEFAGLSEGTHTVQVTVTGGSTDDAVLDSDIDFSSGQAYQIAVIGLAADDDDGDNDLRLDTSEIDISPLGPGQARIRAIHTIPGVGDVTVSTSAGVELFDGVGFGDTSDYDTVEAGDFGIDVTDGDNNSVVTAPDLSLEAGMTYDAFVIGDASDPGTLKLLVVTTQSAVIEGAQGQPIEVPQQGAEQPSPVGEASAEVAGSNEGTPTTVGDADVTPVLTVEATATP